MPRKRADKCSADELERMAWSRTNKTIRHGMVTMNIMSDKELAERLHISPKTLSDRMTMKHPWRQDELYRACRVLGIGKEDAARMLLGA